MRPDDRDALAAKRICHDCVREAFLSGAISRDGTIAFCDYCGDEAKTWPVGDLAAAVEQAFESHFVRTPTEPEPAEYPFYADREFGRMWYRDGQPTKEAIEEAAQVPAHAAADVQALLEDRHDVIDAGRMGQETEFASDAHYGWKGPDAAEWHLEWQSFEEALKTEARFFSRAAADLLARVFGNVDALKGKRRPLVVTAGPNSRLTHLYRARVFQSDDDLRRALCHPDRQLGPPPVRAASAGRMNAQGISVFYGATIALVALAEVRPPVGSKVAIAKFTILRPLRLLNLMALDAVHEDGSIFDPTLRGRLERVAFLRSLGERMTRPVMPNDEALDYLVTQAIADFLATENEPRLDGIIFRSAQSKGGRNVVLFHKAACVEEMPLPQGTELEAHTGTYTAEGWESEYSVSEVVPKPALSKENRSKDGPAPRLGHAGDPWVEVGDFRAVTLQVDPSSVAVHFVEWVTVRSNRHIVHRHRSEKRDWKF